MECLSHQPIPPEADPAGAEHFARLPALWATIYGPQHGFLGLFSATRHGRRLRRPGAAFFCYPQERAAARAWVQDQAALDRELYHCAHLLRQPQRRKQTAAPLQSLYVDLDYADIDRDFPAPTLVVASSPGRWQAYWRLTEPVAPVVGEALNRRLAAALGADPSGWDLTQLLRVPGTHNHKYPDAPPVELVAARSIAYPVALLDVVLPEVPPPPREQGPADYPDGPTVVGEAPVPLSGIAVALWTGERVRRTANGKLDRSASLVRLAQVLADAGATREQIMGALWERDVSLGWRKYADRPQPHEYYAAIADLVRRSG
jgi:hypothetical protein